MKSKLKRIFSLFLLLLTGHLSADNFSALSDSAKKAYDRQEYIMAIEKYEQILSSGNSSAALHYNLGNSYYRNNQLGKAIYHYEIAKKMSPNDEDILTNLRLASSKTIDKIDVKENFFVNTVKSTIYTFFSTNGWAWATICMSFAAALFFILYVFSGNLIAKRIGFWLGSLSVIVVVLCFITGFGALRNLEKKSQAIITAASVQVTNTPNEKGKMLFSLHEGTKVNVLESNEEWTSIKLDNGNEGWLKTSEIGLF